MLRVLGTIALGVAVGCGGGDDGGGGGGGDVTGTLGGSAVAIADAVSATITQMTQGQTVHTAVIWMSDAPDICADIDAGRRRASSKRLLVELADASGNTISAPAGPGTYLVNTGGTTMTATMSSAVFDASCQTIDAGTANATGGSVVLTAVNGDVFAGTFDVTLATGDHLTGQFAPAACPDLQMIFDPLYGSHCM